MRQKQERNVKAYKKLISVMYQMSCSSHHQTESYCVKSCKDLKLEEGTTLVSLLRDCARSKDLTKGIQIHHHILKRDLLQKNIYVGNTLLHLYARCGEVARAKVLFDQFHTRSQVSWNVLISGYAQHGYAHEVIVCFEKMQEEGILPDTVTYVCVLKACGGLQAIERGMEIHKEIVKKGMLENNSFIGNALIRMYAKCSRLKTAQNVFNEIPVRNVVTCNTLIVGFIEHEDPIEALDVFEWMHSNDILPNVTTYACILKACGSAKAAGEGMAVHYEIVRKGFYEDKMVRNALVDMYCKCGELLEAQQVFNMLPDQCVISWTALISGYVVHGSDEAAINCFLQMLFEGISINAITVCCVLKACACKGRVGKGKEIHIAIIQEGLLSKNVYVGNALVDMYAKCGEVEKAQRVFNELPTRNRVTWNILLTGYVQHGHGEEALNSFEQMHYEGISPDAVSFSSALKACGLIGAADKGKGMHSELLREGFLEHNVLVGTALVDMYAKCGLLSTAQQVFDELPAQNVITWTALIGGYVQIGQYDAVFNSFQKMIENGTQPNLVTFSTVLCACCQLNLLNEAQTFFESMFTCYGIIPTLNHYTYMADLFGRSGQFQKAMLVVEKMPSSDYPPVWFALLDACRKWGNLTLGRRAFNNILCLNEQNVTRNVYI